MPGERPLTDAEAELRILLDVEPAPEFAARVRARVANQPMAGRWRLAPWAAVAATVVVAAGLGVTALRWQPAAPEVPQPQDVNLPLVRSAPRQDLPSPGPEEPRRQPARLARRGAAVAPTPRLAEPHVLIDPRQQQGLTRLLELARAGTLEDRAFQSTREGLDPAVSGIEPAPVVVPLVVVDPITVSAVTDKTFDRS